MKREHCYVEAGKIKIPFKFVNHPPKEAKLNSYRRDFWEDRLGFRAKKPIIIDEDYRIIDGYISYLIYKEFYELLGLNFEKQPLLVYKEVGDYRHELTTYVYGRHPNSNKEYVWRMPKTIDYIPEIGETVLASTSKGDVPAIVTKTLVSDKCPYDGKVKLIQAIYEDKKDDEPKEQTSNDCWEEFRKSGMLWYVNTMLKPLGWSICFLTDKKDNLEEVLAVKGSYTFTEEESVRGYKKFSTYLDKDKENA